MTRARQALPEPPDDLSDFPAVDVPLDLTVYRAHTGGREPWWFAAAPADPDDGGRFDVAPPRGTCYLALDPSTAVREKLAEELLDRAMVGPDVPATIAVFRLNLQEPARLADTSSSKAEGRVTREITSTVDYALTRRWAAEFDRDDFDGVLYESRSTTRPEATAIALFGPQGLRRWPVEGGLDVAVVLDDMDVRVAGFRPTHHARAAPPRA